MGRAGTLTTRTKAQKGSSESKPVARNSAVPMSGAEPSIAIAQTRDSAPQSVSVAESLSEMTEPSTVPLRPETTVTPPKTSVGEIPPAASTAACPPSTAFTKVGTQTVIAPIAKLDAAAPKTESSTEGVAKTARTSRNQPPRPAPPSSPEAAPAARLQKAPAPPCTSPA